MGSERQRWTSEGFPVGSTEGLDLAEAPAVRVRGYAGVAFRVEGWASFWEPSTYLATDPEDGTEVEVESDEDGEWVDDHSRVVVRMVGDDRLFVVDPDDVTPLAEQEFCDSCGQLGCAHASAGMGVGAA